MLPITSSLYSYVATRQWRWRRQRPGRVGFDLQSVEACRPGRHQSRRHSWRRHSGSNQVFGKFLGRSRNPKVDAASLPPVRDPNASLPWDDSSTIDGLPANLTMKYARLTAEAALLKDPVAPVQRREPTKPVAKPAISLYRSSIHEGQEAFTLAGAVEFRRPSRFSGLCGHLRSHSHLPEVTGSPEW